MIIHVLQASPVARIIYVRDTEVCIGAQHMQNILHKFYHEIGCIFCTGACSFVGGPGPTWPHRWLRANYGHATQINSNARADQMKWGGGLSLPPSPPTVNASKAQEHLDLWDDILHDKTVRFSTFSSAYSCNSSLDFIEAVIMPSCMDKC